MAKLLVPIVALLAVAIAISMSDRSGPRADFTFINRGEVNTVDPQRMAWMQDLRVARLLYEGLVQNDVFDTDFGIEPAIATRVPDPEYFTEIIELRTGRLLRSGPDESAGEGEVAFRRSSYTFPLRTDAKWSNGEPVTAHDFVYSWRRGMLPDSASEYVGVFHLMRGASAFTSFRSAMLEQYQRMPLSESEPEEDAFPTLESIFERNERSSRAAMRLFELCVEVFMEGLPRERADAIVTIPSQRARLGLDEASDSTWELDRGVGVIALDDHTLEVTLERPLAYFMDLCAFAVTYPVYPPLVSAHEFPKRESGALELRSDWTKPGRLVSNGPFMLKQWRFKRDMRLEQNPHWWNRGSLAIRTIDIPSVEDPSAAVLAFETGQVDYVSDVVADYRGDIWEAKKEFYDEHREEYERLKAMGLDQIEIDRRLPPDPRKNIHVIPAFGTYFFYFNCNENLNDGTPNPYSDPRVRRAFALTMDKEAVSSDIRRLDEPVTGSLVPAGAIGGYDPPPGLPSIGSLQGAAQAGQAEQARELLLEAMRDRGMGDSIADFPVVEILFNKEGGHDLIAQAVGKGWEKHLGVRVRYVQQELKTFRIDRQTQNFTVARAGWYGDYGDPTTFLETLRTGDGNNDAAYANPAFDALLDQAALENDPVRRFEILQEAERIVVQDDLPLVPVFIYSNVYMFDPHKVSGVTPHPRSKQNLFVVDMLNDDRGSNEALRLEPKGDAQ